MDNVHVGASRVVLDDADLARVLRRIAHEIVEKAKGTNDLILLGIPTRGVILAERIADEIMRFEGVRVPTGALDITLYRDDLELRSVRALEQTHIPVGGIDHATVVLVDDVLFSGRTIRAALDALNDLGRPDVVRLAVVIDRGHRELPIRPDYVGKNLPTSRSEQVRVMIAEIDGIDQVALDGGEI
jgi:pyrimidine operon attenuation protein / uracil phosphoribosyltransferase